MRSVIIMQKRSGFIFGVLLLLSLIYSPLFLLGLAVLSRLDTTAKPYRTIIALSLSGLALIVLVLSISRRGFDSGLLNQVFALVVLAIVVLKKIDKSFLEGLYSPIAILFALDLAVNFAGIAFDYHIFGRGAGIREGEFFPRVGGIFGHTFYSINISLCFMLMSSALEKKWLGALGAVNVFAAGANRGLIYLSLFFLYVVILRRFRWSVKVIAAFLAIAATVFITFLSVEDIGSIGSIANKYRVFAWLNAVDMIADNPLLGFPGKFETWDSETGVSENSIQSTGTTESGFLGDALYYGMIYALIKLWLYVYIIRINDRLNEVTLASTNLGPVAFVSFLVLYDYFVGSLFGAILVTSVFSILISYGFYVGADSSLKRNGVLRR